MLICGSGKVNSVIRTNHNIFGVLV